MVAAHPRGRETNPTARWGGRVWGFFMRSNFDIKVENDAIWRWIFRRRREWRVEPDRENTSGWPGASRRPVAVKQPTTRTTPPARCSRVKRRRSLQGRFEHHEPHPRAGRGVEVPTTCSTASPRSVSRRELHLDRDALGLGADAPVDDEVERPLPGVLTLDAAAAVHDALEEGHQHQVGPTLQGEALAEVPVLRARRSATPPSASARRAARRRPRTTFPLGQRPASTR